MAFGSKCDFTFSPWDEVSNPAWFQKDITAFLSKRSIGPSGLRSRRMQLDSDEGRFEVNYAEDGWTLSSTSGGFQGVVGHSSGGWAVGGLDRGIGGIVSSSKCDWRVITPGLEARGLAGRPATDLTVQLGGGLVSGGSSKCDWRIAIDQDRWRVLAKRTPSGVGLTGGLPGFRGGISSSKCDWRVQLENRDQFVEGLAAAASSAVKVKTPTMDTRVNSDGSDWRITSEPGRRGGAGLPSLDAILTSSKCDYRFTFSLRLGEGPALEFGGIRSSKCDFRVDTLEFSEDGKRFQTLISGDPKGSC